MLNLNLFAYLDPGTGSLVLQAVVGAILGVIVVMRNQIRLFVGKVKSTVTGSKSADKQGEDKDK